MKRRLFTVFPTEERMNRSSELPSGLDSFWCVAERVLRITAQAWVLPPPATASALAIARAAASFSRRRDAAKLTCC